MNNRLDSIPEYLAWAQTRVDPRPISRSSYVAYRSKLRQFATWVGDSDRPISIELLREYIDYLENERPARDGNAGQRPRTIKCAVLPLLGWLEWRGERWPELRLPLVKKLRLPALDEAQREVPSDEDIAAMFTAAETMDDFTRQNRFERARAVLIVSLSVDAGLRRCEILGLDLNDIHQDSAGWWVQIREGKGQKKRAVPLNRRCRRCVEEYLRVRQEWCDHTPARHQNRALFAVDRSRRFNEESMLRLRHHLLHRAGLANRALHWHSNRHYFISTSLEAPGATVADVAALAGHSSTRTTEAYLHARDKGMRRAVEAVCDATEPSVELPHRPMPERTREHRPRPRPGQFKAERSGDGRRVRLRA